MNVLRFKQGTRRDLQDSYCAHELPCAPGDTAEARPRLELYASPRFTPNPATFGCHTAAAAGLHNCASVPNKFQADVGCGEGSGRRMSMPVLSTDHIRMIYEQPGLLTGQQRGHIAFGQMSTG